MTQPHIQWLPKRLVAERYNASARTIERWVKQGRLPKPTRLPNGRDYWANTVLEEHERNLVGGGEAA
jgi:predicted site-specific integrase-resolvase